MDMYKPLLLVLLAIGCSKGIQVGPVRLKNGLEYITYGLGASPSLSVLECPISLKSDETLRQVSWVFNDVDKPVGHYNWTVGRGGKADGRLEGAVKLDRPDGSLELTELRYDLAGFYSCSASTEGGKKGEAAPWEVLIIDFTANSVSENLLPKGPCNFSSSYSKSATFPEPSIHSGLYSDTLGAYVEEVSAIQWKKIRWDNKSYSYSYDNINFKIRQNTPHDVYFLNSFGFIKRDGTFIPAMSSRGTLQMFSATGCRPIKLDEYQKVEYSNGNKRTCRGEMAYPLTGTLTATVSCIEGYIPSGHPEVTHVELTCIKDTLKWKISDGQEDLSNIKCIIDDSHHNLAVTNAISSLLNVSVCLMLVQFLRH